MGSVCSCTKNARNLVIHTAPEKRDASRMFSSYTDVDWQEDGKHMVVSRGITDNPNERVRFITEIKHPKKNTESKVKVVQLSEASLKQSELLEKLSRLQLEKSNGKTKQDNKLLMAETPEKSTEPSD